MQTIILYQLAVDLRRKISPGRWEKDTFDLCMDSRKQEIFEYMTIICDELAYAIRDTWKDNKKVDKEVERRLKHALYRLKNFLDHIKAFENGGYGPLVSSLDSFISSGREEVKLIREELKPFSGKHHWLVTKSVGCREYKLQLEELIQLLLNPDSGTVVPILSKFPSGKSTLLGLALDDSRVQDHFTTTKYLNYNNKYQSYKSLVKELDSENAHGKKMLIMIDNARASILSNWQEIEDQSLYKGLVKRAGQGSKIVITSRLEPEKIGGHILPTVLRFSGLSPSEACNLFIRTAFPDGEDLEERLKTLWNLIHQICEKCEYLPGVIMIIATILSFKSSPEEWKHFLDVVMTSVPDPITTITVVLQWIPYDPYYEQRICDNVLREEWYYIFSWCSLLPKDYTFTKNDFLNLLTVEYMHKHKIRHSAQSSSDQWFDAFVMQGYFIECNDGGTTVRYKISSLGYELMKYVAADDYCLVDDPAVAIHHKVIRHISFVVDASWEPPSWLPQADLLQSLWLWPRNSGDFIPLSKINSTLSRMEPLHAFVHRERIPQFLVEFKKVKYLRLGVVCTVSLPGEIPVLQKLCDPYCTRLVDDKRSAQAKAVHDLLVSFPFRKLTIQPEEGNVPDLFKTQYSLYVERRFIQSLNAESIISSSFHEENKMKSTSLHLTLESLKVHCWTGENWPIDDVSFLAKNLVSLEFGNCRRIRHLPAFTSLPHLSSFHLWGMSSLEDILTIDEKNEASSTRTIYPSLKILVLWDLPKFKGWSHKEGDYFPLLAQLRVQGCPKLMSMPSAPMLKSLEAINVNAKLMKHLNYPIQSTLRSTSLTPVTNNVSSQESSPCPVTNLEIDGCTEFDLVNKEIWLAFSCLRSLKLNNIRQLVSLPDGLECITTLEHLSLCWLTNLKSLPEWMTKLRRLTIHYCVKLTKLPSSFSSLQQLDIRYCPRLSQFPESLHNLKRLGVQEICQFKQILLASQNLEELEINNCQDLDYDTQSTEGNSSVRVWDGHKLRSLKMTKMEDFPKSIDFEKLIGLCHLTIKSCPRLTKLPPALKNLQSLTHLEIRMSPELEKRCKKRGGEDSNLIQHIPNIICGN